MNTVFDSEPQCKIAENVVLSEEQVAEIKGRCNRREATVQIARSMGLTTGYVIAALTEKRYKHIRASDSGLLPQPYAEFADRDLVLLKQSVRSLNDAMKRLGLI